MAGVLFNVADRIIGNLASLAFKEIELLLGVKDEREKLKDTVSAIQAVLLDAEEQQVESHAVRDWLEKLEDAMYDADDLLDDFSTEALRREVMTRDKMAKEVRIFFSKSNQLLYAHKMGHNIMAIRKRLDTINAVAKDFNLKVRRKETSIRNKKRDNTHSFVRAEEVIGREHDKKEVMERLMDSNVEENVLILPIVGIGGLGKTALAQLIFNDEKIEKHFQLKMWVCVSDNFDEKIIVEKILGSTTNSDMNILVNNLQEKIDGNKYLLVLDDVWNENREKWLGLKKLLMGGARGSRILVTTRSKKVEKITHTIKPYLLEGLDEQASWSLFKQMAFERGQDLENPSMVAIGKEIVKKCVGVPLAIRTVGSLLYLKNSETEWLSFKDDELSKISQEENDILPTLKLSYDNLPSHLKHCFAYCSLFLKDYKINRSTLIKLWIAQGFVKSSNNQNQCLEDVGNGYFMDLLWRSFFQEAEIDEFGNVIACKMHDLMHDLAISVAGSMTTTLDAKKRNIDEKTRHVSFDGYCDVILSSISTSLYKTSRIRTFLCYKEFDCDAIFSSFKLLRVLHLRYLHFVPSSIEKLKHLRYFDLSENQNIEKLPNSITRLQNLQTLRLIKCPSLKELPRNIKRLFNLRHLEINGCNALTYMPRGLGHLTNLQTLSKFVVHSGSSNSSGLQELNGLNKLRGELEITNVGHGKGVASKCLKEKQHLHSLKLLWSPEGDGNDKASLECFQPHQNLKELFLTRYRGSRLPSWLLSLTNLVRFELNGCRKCQYLPQLSQLPSLKYLSLKFMNDMEYISDSNEFSSSSSAPIPFFPSLQEIRLSDCPNLKGWWRKRDSSVEVNSDSDNSVEITEHRLLLSFPRLSKLRIGNCPMLTSMPMFPHLEEELSLYIASSKPLQQTMMMNMSESQSPTSTASTSHSSTPLSKLKSLKLKKVADLETLPGIQYLTALQELEINDCLSLASLPEGMRSLTSLRRLTITDCPILLQRCERDTGEDWAKIAHIPHLQLSYLWFQLRVKIGTW